MLNSAETTASVCATPACEPGGEIDLRSEVNRTTPRLFKPAAEGRPPVDRSAPGLGSGFAQPTQRPAHRVVEIGVVEAVEQPKPGSHSFEEGAALVHRQVPGGNHDHGELVVVQCKHGR
jgi:hypothetical protein